MTRKIESVFGKFIFAAVSGIVLTFSILFAIYKDYLISIILFLLFPVLIYCQFFICSTIMFEDDVIYVYNKFKRKEIKYRDIKKIVLYEQQVHGSGGLGGNVLYFEFFMNDNNIIKVGVGPVATYQSAIKFVKDVSSRKCIKFSHKKYN